MQQQKFEKIKKYLLLAGWAVLITACWLWRDRITVEGILNFAPENYLLAFFVFMGLFALKSLSVVFYSGILFTASGILFPLPLALAVDLSGLVVMLTIPYLLGRRIGTGLVEALIRKYPKAKLLQQLSRGNEFQFAMLARLISVLPADPLSMYMGATGMSYAPFLLGSICGFLPEMLAFTVMGDNVSDPLSLPFILAAVLKAGALAAALLYCRKALKNAE